MDQAGIIRDLLVWLEAVAIDLYRWIMWRQSGLFQMAPATYVQDVTGHAIGAYIRARRLSKSAVALRLTARPILDIAAIPF